MQEMNGAAVPPGEAEALCLHWHARAARLASEGSLPSDATLTVEWWEYHRARAAEIHQCIAEFGEMLRTGKAPKPDSDAVKPDGVDTTEGIYSANRWVTPVASGAAGERQRGDAPAAVRKLN